MFIAEKHLAPTELKFCIGLFSYRRSAPTERGDTGAETNLNVNPSQLSQPYSPSAAYLNNRNRYRWLSRMFFATTP